jgi:hypothetical protein
MFFGTKRVNNLKSNVPVKAKETESESFSNKIFLINYTFQGI